MFHMKYINEVTLFELKFWPKAITLFVVTWVFFLQHLYPTDVLYTPLNLILHMSSMTHIHTQSFPGIASYHSSFTGMLLQSSFFFLLM